MESTNERASVHPLAPEAPTTKTHVRARLFAIAVAFAMLAQPVVAQTPPPAPQNPSPMVEHSRAHARLEPRELDGVRLTLERVLPRPVEVFVPARAHRARSMKLVVFFHGASFVPAIAVSQLGDGYIAASTTLGNGSGVYDRTFSTPGVYDTLLAAVARGLADSLGHAVRFDDVTLVGFSAGHGAVRAVLRDSAHFAAVNAVLLLDGMHTSYVPEGTVLAKGGVLDTTNLAAFTRFARAAMRGEKRFAITHSEIFPGTFASTTETADYLVKTLGLSRTSVLKWGPVGMQQTSEVQSGRLDILGFAGNSAPDHIDHLHGLPEFLRLVRR